VLVLYGEQCFSRVVRHIRVPQARTIGDVQRVLAGGLGAVRGRIGAIAPVLDCAGNVPGPLQPHHKDIAAAEPAVARLVARLQRKALVRSLMEEHTCFEHRNMDLPCCASEDTIGTYRSVLDCASHGHQRS